MLDISDTSGYRNSKKNIKNNHESLEILNKVLSHIESSDSTRSLKTSFISKVYGFEELKDDLSGYCRFSLCKNAHTGKIRLIFSIKGEKSVRLEYISNDHYEDFKRYLRKVGGKK